MVWPNHVLKHAMGVHAGAAVCVDRYLLFRGEQQKWYMPETHDDCIEVCYG